jgi:HAD superfamily phosphoserine phosphatase-like hydrolase
MEKIHWHQKEGHRIVIVSASMKCWLDAWCKNNHIELISTKLEVIDGKLSGKFATKNCHGIEKANRIREMFDLGNYDHIYAYGDSSGDREMLALADESFYKPFRES